MNPIWYVLIGYLLGQGSCILAMYIGSIFKTGDDSCELH